MSHRSGPSAIVVGVGSSMRGDDGLGPRAIELLGERLDSEPSVELRAVDGDPARMIEAWRGRAVAIVVDAVRTGAPPGTVHRIDHGSAGLVAGRAASTHSGGVAEAIALATQLDLMPQRLVVLGVEPVSFELGTELSAPVREAMPALVERILAELAT